jgi:membrane-associated protein
MLELAIQWKDFLNPEFYIQHGGLWLFLFIVFAETGLFAGFFLPGDSLLFVSIYF